MNTSDGTRERPALSIVTPAFNEARNLPALFERLRRTCEVQASDWEWIVVDDHSADATFEGVRELALRDRRVRGLRLARNSGSHVAIRCGFDHAAGDVAAVLAADLQDPPELLADLLAEWRRGAQVVWAVRRRRRGETGTKLGFARLYYFIMRHVVGLKDMPPTGADFFLVDRRVVEALRQFRERRVSLFALLTWLGFRQASVFYDKQPRLYGASGWSLAKKIRLLVDSVTSFSVTPLRVVTGIGLVLAVLILAAAGWLLASAGDPRLSIGLWVLVAVAVLVAVQLLAIGILGEYVWRALDEAQRRPLFLVEAAVGFGEQPPALSATSPSQVIGRP